MDVSNPSLFLSGVDEDSLPLPPQAGSVQMQRLFLQLLYPGSGTYRTMTAENVPDVPGALLSVWCLWPPQDILFDSTTQLVKKFVLHTNFPEIGRAHV